MIVELDIWELVMFPLIERSIVAPLSVIVGTLVAEEIGVGDGVGDGVGSVVGLGVGVGLEVESAIGVGVEVGLTVNELLIPIWPLPSSTPRIMPEPATVTVTKPVQTPLKKPPVAKDGEITPAEYVKIGVPL